MSEAARRWAGRAFLGMGRALYLGPAADTTAHAHHAIQVCVGLEGPVQLRGGTGERSFRVPGALVGSGRMHQFDGGGRSVLLLYVEPETADGRHLGSQGGTRGIYPLSSRVVEAIRRDVASVVPERLDGGKAAALSASVLAHLGVTLRTTAPLEERALRVIRRLREAPGAPWRVAELAEGVGLSPRHFRTLFTREVGMTCRQYILWVRLYEALCRVVRGASLTEAALAAGFADAAHLTRTFRRMFGIPPSAISPAVSFMEPPAA